MEIAQSSTLPPAQPVYVLRGHSAQIHAVRFLRKYLRLLSGDADGWVVLWNIPIKRPAAVWQPHRGAILGLGSWDNDKIITHGRDNKLCVWQLREEDEVQGMSSTTLPIDDAESERKKPWLLHSLPVNALNFCSFAMCRAPASTPSAGEAAPRNSILVAVPGLRDGHVNVTSLPSEERVASIIDPKTIKTGMVMAIGLQVLDDKVQVIAGYESGYVCVFTQRSTTDQWQNTYTHKAHTQPVLSLDISSKLGCFYSSSADDLITRHPLVTGNTELKTVHTKHAGQQSLTVRTDGRIFATAGWDGRVRVYSAKTMKELAVLKWHKEGCYALAFATSDDSDNDAGVVDQSESAIVKRDLTVSDQRVRKAKETHWLAAGSKDGKVSLWDVY